MTRGTGDASFHIGLTWRTVGWLVFGGLVVGLAVGFLAGRAFG